jgi:hypothetical protein
MTRYRGAGMVWSLVACAPAVTMDGTDDGTSSSSSSNGSEASGGREPSASSDESGDSEACRELPTQLAARWSTVIDPDTLSYGAWSQATADGGAIVAGSSSMVTFDGTGATTAVQWFGSLRADAFELGDDDEVWVAGSDGQLTVARYDATGELARGGRAALDDEYAVGIVRDPDGGAFVLSSADGLRLDHVDASMAFGAPVMIATRGLPWGQLHAGGLVLVTQHVIDTGVITAFDRSGAELWHTELPLDAGAEVPLLGATTSIGDVLYLALTQNDLADQYSPATQWLFGLDIDDGARRFEIDTTSSVITAAPCGGVYVLELVEQDGTAPRIVLVEHDAFGELRAQAELAAPVVPAGFELIAPRDVDVAADGTIVVHGYLDHTELGVVSLDWVAAY